MVRVLTAQNQRRMIDRMGEDFAQLRRLADDESGVDWRALVFPFHDGERIDAVSLYYRRRNAEADDADEGLRFVVDLDMSALGALQLDGLVREKQFDLIFRSHIVMPEQMQRDLNKIFQDALDATGYRGGLFFQAASTFPVSPMAEIADHEDTAGAVLA
jgi:hypothetical protein